MKRYLIITIIASACSICAVSQQMRKTPQVKVVLPDRNYSKKIEKLFYDSLWIGKSLWKSNEKQFSDLRSYGYNYEQIDPKLISFHYVPSFKVKASAQNIKKNQGEYEIFELDSIDKTYSVKYKDDFIGIVNTYRNKGQNQLQAYMYLQDSKVTHDANSIYSQYVKSKGRVFRVNGLGNADWWLLEKDSELWVYDLYDKEKHFKPAYDFVNAKIEDIKKLAKGKQLGGIVDTSDEMKVVRSPEDTVLSIKKYPSDLTGELMVAKEFNNFEQKAIACFNESRRQDLKTIKESFYLNIYALRDGTIKEVTCSIGLTSTISENELQNVIRNLKGQKIVIPPFLTNDEYFKSYEYFKFIVPVHFNNAIKE